MSRALLFTALTTTTLLVAPAYLSKAESDQPSKIRQLLDSIADYTSHSDQPQPVAEPPQQDTKVQDVLRDIEEFERTTPQDHPKALFSKPNFALDEDTMGSDDLPLDPEESSTQRTPSEDTEKRSNVETFITPEDYIKDDEGSLRKTTPSPSFKAFPDPEVIDGYPDQKAAPLPVPAEPTAEEIAKQREQIGKMLGEIDQVSSSDPSQTTFDQEWPIVELRIIDKITSKRSIVKVPMDKTLVFEDSLKVTPRRCIQSRPEDPKESTAFIEVRETMPHEEEKSIFGGWMIASKPGVSGLEHPTFDVVVVSCRKPQEETTPPPPVVKTDAEPKKSPN